MLRRFFPADLLARNLVDRAPLDRDDLQTVRDFVLEKAIFFGIAGALAALAVGFLSRRRASRWSRSCSAWEPGSSPAPSTRAPTRA